MDVEVCAGLCGCESGLRSTPTYQPWFRRSLNHGASPRAPSPLLATHGHRGACCCQGSVCCPTSSSCFGDRDSCRPMAEQQALTSFFMDPLSGSPGLLLEALRQKADISTAKS